MADLTIDPFAKYTFGRLALKKLSGLPSNFRLYKAGWLGSGNERDVMELTGAEFRIAMSGKNKGKMSIKVPKTDRSVFVTSKEVAAADAAKARRAAKAKVKQEPEAAPA